VDMARIIAIVLIVGFHVAYEFIPDSVLRPMGFIGASLFFIASGYMLAGKYPELVGFDINWLKKRWLRIAALYYPALICMALLFGSQAYFGGLKDLALHFLFLNWVSPDTAYSIISPAWFLVPLIGLYILFPFLNGIMKRGGSMLLLPVFLLAIANRMLVSGTWVTFSPIFFLGEFCYGIALARSERRWQFLGLAVLPAIINPLMVLPFALFLALGKLGDRITSLPKPIAIVAANTFEIFLFHESVMEVALGKWSILGQGTLASLAILAAAIAAVMLASKRLALYFFHK
jgi:peptidoglycan/LPS O-acetylase OafA/YrhL